MADSLYKSKDLGRNLLLFEGLTFGRTISPTDIDMMLESRGQIFILGEFKHMNNHEIPEGQRLLIERMIYSWDVPAIAFLATHRCDGDVTAADCKVRRIYYNEFFSEVHRGKWIPTRAVKNTELTNQLTGITVKEFVDILAEQYEFALKPEED